FSIVAGPLHGALSGVAPNLTYTPAAGYNGPDSFTFKANDGTVDSSAATVSLTVTAVNDAPVANAQTVTTAEDTAKAIVLTATDVDGDPLTYAIVAGPAHGTLSGVAPTVTYTPAANYNGPDSVTFKANDGTLNSNVATVTLTVTPVNDAPVATAQSVTTNQDTAKAMTLTATDVDGDTLTYAVVTAPTHGTLSGVAPNLTYTPAAGYNGPDSFTFKANDGTVDSAAATVSLTVVHVNHAPGRRSC
ncbi:MAG: adhesin, partial [Acidobacteria bacterium]